MAVRSWVQRKSYLCGAAALVAVCIASSQVEASDDGFVIGFHNITLATATRDPGGVPAEPQGSGIPRTVLNAEPHSIYEGRWTTGQAVTIVPSSAADAEATALSPAFRDFDVVAFFSRAPRGAAPKPENVPAGCDDPMLLLGFTRVTDINGNTAYSRAVVGSNLPRLHGFTPLFGGQPTKLYRGQWPDGYTVSTSMWPCANAFETFFYSRRYQDQIKPYRRQAGDYIIVGFSPAFVPE